MISIKLIQQDKNSAYELAELGWKVGDWIEYQKTEKEKLSESQQAAEILKEKAKLEVIDLKKRIHPKGPFIVSILAALIAAANIIVTNLRADKQNHKIDLLEYQLQTESTKIEKLERFAADTTKPKPAAKKK